ncbi:MAG: hypothetical protein HZC28_18080 [Spirochaetes bacterium]|nr:hypothetical protein [Spirochaetota bacterium]
MKLSVPYFGTKRMNAKSAARALDAFPRTAIAQTPWAEFPYKPETTFTLAYGDDAFYIRYNVREKELLALYQYPNQPVCKDSCVEFFVSPDGKSYYNIEFNCIGACYIAVGPDRAHRRMIHPKLVATADVFSTLGKKPFEQRTGDFTWELTAVIPYAIMANPAGAPSRGKTFTANFYKCSDEMTTPHYLTWNNVGTIEPDYHQPEYFGEIEFF